MDQLPLYPSPFNLSPFTLFPVTLFPVSPFSRLPFTPPRLPSYPFSLSFFSFSSFTRAPPFPLFPHSPFPLAFIRPRRGFHRAFQGAEGFLYAAIALLGRYEGGVRPTAEEHSDQALHQPLDWRRAGAWDLGLGARDWGSGVRDSELGN